MYQKNLDKLILIFGISLLAITGFYFTKTTFIWQSDPFPLIPRYKALDISKFEQKSTIGIKENIADRIAYENTMLADPKTGLIPKDIKKLNQVFAQKLYRKTHANKSARQLTQLQREETEWESNGPFAVGGRTRALGLDITNEDILLAGGTSGGMWRSTDQGSSWNKVTAPGALHSVTTITQDIRAGKENVWYYGSGELSGNSARGGGSAIYRGDGIFKSIDGGLSWALLPATSQGEPNKFTVGFQFVWNITTNHLNTSQDEVMAATFGGIQRSADGGGTWDYVLGQASNMSSVYSDVVINEQGIYYASLSSSSSDSISTFRGIYRSENGISWAEITPNNFPVNYDRVVIGASATNPNVIYFLADSNPNDLWKYTYLSGNGSGSGGQWTDLTKNIPMFGGSVGDFDSQGSYNMMIAVHPSDENIVFLGGTNIYRSTDGFTSSNNTSWVGGYNNTNDISDYPGHHPDQHNLLFFTSTPNKVISAHDGGLSISTDIMANNVIWDNINNGYITSQFYTIAIGASNNNNTIVGGLQDNGSYLTLNGQNNAVWSRILGGDGGYAAIAHEGANIYVSSQNSRIIRYFRQDNEFVPVSRIDPSQAGKKEGQEFLFVNPFIIDPFNNSKMYLAGGDRIWLNPNVTQIPGSADSTAINWIDIPQTRINSGQISSLAISSTPRNILYYGSTNGLLFKMINADTYSPQVDNITNNVFPPGGYVSCVAVDPTNADNVMIIFSNYNVNSIFYSQDGGQSFTSVGGNLEENDDGSGNGPSIRWATIVPKTNNQYRFFVGTSTGLYSSETLNGNNTIWEQEGKEIIGNVVVPMIQYRASDGKVVIATHGNGVYSKTFDNVLNVITEPEGDPFELSQNYPNPFSDFTTIKFNLPEQSFARLRIYDSQGKKVRTLLLATQFAGENEVIWDGKDGNGVSLANGIYYYRLEYGLTTFFDENITKKLILIR